ncbi:phosphatase PAP2 family protein [Parashewanella tropica]|uniref:phosphatase PAP2 family protein n=1 Tax=Parashewanella tropica TaxID=2547970 RepID=UPI001059C107|nr:phosphatase PAP2 family protein [Parashewanella tropica]
MPSVSRILYSISALLTIFAFISFVFWDKPIALYCYQTFEGTSLFEVIQLLGISTGKLVMLAFAFVLGLYVLAYYLKGKTETISEIKVLFGGYSLALVITHLLKYLLGRYRPKLFIEHDWYGFHGFSFLHDYNSMPSGHATFAAGLIIPVGLLMYQKNKMLALFTIGFGIMLGLSRIIISIHFLSDVLVGMAIGLSCFAFALQKIQKY